MPSSTDLTQLKIYHATTNAIAQAAISGGQVDANSIVVTDELDPTVTSIGNATGDISLGSGLAISSNVLTNTGVFDVKDSSNVSIVNNHIATLPAVYAHHIYMIGGNQNKTNVYCTLITNFSTSFDLPSFIAYVNNLTTISSEPTLSATGTVIYNRVGTVEYCRTVAALIPGDAENNTIGIIYHDTGDAGVVKTFTAKQGTGNLDLTSLTDTVIKVI